ncbi:MAG TPA: DUF2007 domain-containing protein [Candidatus Hydrogenedentes bacterium]|nr:DUF2007 domain-containing protein [Candidatus Hydrogenedentota bacterium]
MSEDMEDHELVSVHECENDDEADIIIALLEANGIEAFLSTEMPHSVLPVSDDAHVLVNREDEEEALRIIEESIEDPEEEEE